MARALLSVSLVLFTVRACSSLRQTSATFDETNYFGMGQYLLETGRWGVPGSILHPPLFYYVSSLPLLGEPFDPTVWRGDSARTADARYLAGGDIERGQALLSSPGNQDDRLLTRARLTSVAMALVLTCFVFAWSHRLYGPAAAAFSALLVTFSPEILAHAGLVTPDIGLTTLLFATVYGLWRFLRSGDMRWAAAAGLMLGLALGFKFTALILLPVLIALTLLWRLTGRPVRWIGIAFLFLAGCLLLVASYRGHLAPLWAGLTVQRDLAREGHPSFLFGVVSNQGWWYYLIVAFLVKTPVAALILTVLTLATGRRRDRVDRIDHAFLWVPAAALTVFFSLQPQSIGLRYLLPVYPFFFVFISQAAATTVRANRRLIALVAALGCWYAGASLWIHPNYLAYFNEFAGGPRNGYRVLVDSNLDWGQGLKQLKQFMEARRIGTVSLSYFGTDDPRRHGIDYVALPSVMLRPTPDRRPDPNGWFAISATNLQGVYFRGADPFAAFRDRPPDAVVGYSIFLYRGLR